MNEIKLKNGNEVNLREAINSKDFICISKLAKIIWPEVYKNVIDDEHIEFLLQKYFTLNNMKKYISEGFKYFIIEENEPIGFVSYKTFDDYIYLDKFYLLEHFRQKNIFKNFVENMHKETKKPLKLNVNQKNQEAITAYLKIGFTIEKEEKIKLNDKMTNIDFVMKYKK